MNIFRFVGDMTHLISFLVLLLKLLASRSASGTKVTLSSFFLSLTDVFPIMIRHIAEITRALPPCVRNTLFGSIHSLCELLQYGNEASVFGVFWRCGLCDTV